MLTLPRFQPWYRQFTGEQMNTIVDSINALSGPGVTYYVNETIGSDRVGNDGQNPGQPLATLDRALELEDTALSRAGLSSVGRNSVIAFWGTQHRTSSLAWSLPATHLLGLGASQRRGKRARISVSGSTAFDKLVNVSAQGCQFSNLGTFYGFNDASANICWYDSAGRSCYDNVEFMGFGDGTASTGTANHTAARAFSFNTNNGESSFYHCVFGVDTVTRNATNYTVEIAGAAPRMYFEDCVFEAYLGASGGSSSHLLIGVGGIDRYLDLVRCRFGASGSSGGTTMTQCLNVNVSAGGTVRLDQSSFYKGITAWQTSPTANVQMDMTSPSSGGGKAITVA